MQAGTKLISREARVVEPSFIGRVRRRSAGAIKRMRTLRRVHTCGPGSFIDKPVALSGGRSIRIGSRSVVMRGARIESFGLGDDPISLDIGDDCNIGPGAHLAAVASVQIGKGVLFASGVYVTDHDHDWSDPRDPASTNGRLLQEPVSIGDFVWLGERVMVLKGVAVGERSIIGAASVVTSDIPPYSVAVGTPARVIRTWDFDACEWVRVPRK